MHCEQSTELMSLELDHMLDEAGRQALEEHLAACVACQETWAAMQRLSALFTEEPMATPGAGFTERVVERLVQRRVRRQLVTGYAVLTVGLLLLLALPLTSLLEPASVAGQAALEPGIRNDLLSLLMRVGTITESFLEAGCVLIRAFLLSLPQSVVITCILLAGGIILFWVRVVGSYLQVGVES